MASDMYTIFGRFFGQAEKYQLTMKRMQETARNYVSNAAGMRKETEHMVEALTAAERAYSKSNTRVVRFKSSLIDLENIQNSGMKMTAKQVNQMAALQNKIELETRTREQAVITLNKQAAQTNDLNGLLAAAESKGNKVSAGVKKFVANHVSLENQLKSSGNKLATFNSIQDNATARGQLLSEVFGSKIFGAIGNAQTKLAGFAKGIHMIGESGGVIAAVGEQFAAFGASMEIIGVTTALAFWPVIAILGLIMASIYTFKTIWKENIGGIQSTFIGVIGKFKNAMAKLDAYFRGVMREWGPQLKPFFTMLGDIAGILIDLLVPVLKLIGFLLKPMFDSFIGMAEVLGKMWQFAKDIAIAFSDVTDSVTGVENSLSKLTENNIFSTDNKYNPYNLLGQGYDTLVGNGINTESVRGGVSSNSVSNNQRFTNQPNIIVHTNNPADSKMAGQVWGDASSEFTNLAKQNGGNY